MQRLQQARLLFAAVTLTALFLVLPGLFLLVFWAGGLLDRPVVLLFFLFWWGGVLLLSVPVTWMLDRFLQNLFLEFERLTELFSSLTEGIVIMDMNRKVTWLNPAADRMTGWAIGDSVPYCAYCKDRQVAADEPRCYLVANRDIDYFESEMETNRESSIAVGINRSFLPGAEGRPGEMVIVLRELSEERRREELHLTRMLARRTLQAQEQERKRLAQELHDAVSQTLHSIGLGIDHLRKRTTEETTRSRLAELHRMLIALIGEIRNLSKSLYPAALYDLGLSASLKALASDVEKTSGIRMEVDSDLPDKALPLETAIELYRIVQEATSNSIRHGQATEIQVHLRRRQGTCRLAVQDNGHGFAADNPSEEGFGLRSIRERAESLGGFSRIVSVVGQGTAVTVEIPAPEGCSRE